MKAKAKYGGVNLRDRNGKLYLDFRFNNQRYQPSLGMVTSPANKSVAKQIASQIELDIALGTFTGDVKRYLNKSDKVKAVDKPKQYSPLELFREWRSATGRTAHHYETTERFLARSKPTWNLLIEKLNISGWSERHRADTTKHLNACIEWGNKTHGLDLTPLKVNRLDHRVNPSRKPFTDDDIKAILKAFKTNQFCKANNRYKHERYYPLVALMFITGCRFGELIGLTPSKIDWDNKVIEVSESLSRVDSYDNRKVIKATKTGTVRHLPLPDTAIELLRGLVIGKKPDDFIFVGHHGKPIDSHNFSQRVWKQVLSGLGISHRVPYATRHTMISRGIEQGVPLTGLAYLAGHKDTTMIQRNYGHMINRPNLPKINLSA